MQQQHGNLQVGSAADKVEPREVDRLVQAREADAPAVAEQ
jgi:hypothetical protein